MLKKEIAPRQKQKRQSRRFFIARVCLYSAICFIIASGYLFVKNPDTFGGFSVVISVGVGGLLGIVNIYMHHESKNKRHFNQP